jgi:hypothetical protein
MLSHSEVEEIESFVSFWQANDDAIAKKGILLDERVKSTKVLINLVDCT